MSARRRSRPGAGRRPAPAPALAVLALLLFLLMVLPALPLAAPRAAAQEPAEGAREELGAVRFPVSCSPDVQEEFEGAVALLHHMMYREARGAFEAISARDRGCAMARWGIAMTLFQPLWPERPGRDALERGREEVRRAKELSPRTERERALIAATEAFYRDPARADWWTRIRRWAQAMERAYREHPDDIEIAAFYALSRLAAGQVAEDRMAWHEEAARVLRRIHEREPTHPGAIHYTIHANDVDARAGESLDIVGSYDRIAPSVPHALHMPTHIYVRLGEWPEVIRWNRRSADAALRRSEGDAATLHYVHAMDYLVYAHLQRAEDSAARAALEEARGRGPHQESFVTAYHLAAMPARLAVERRAWEEAASVEPRTPGYLAWDRYPWPEGLSWLARGLGAAETGDLEEARRAEARLGELRDRARAEGEETFARYIEVDRLVLTARIARAKGDAGTAVESARSAAELEETLEKNPVSPGALLPAHEALGDLLLDLGKPAAAIEAYRAGLETWPGRYNSLLGAARAARASGDEAAAREHYSALLEVVGDPESPRAGIREAREFLAGGG